MIGRPKAQTTVTAKRDKGGAGSSLARSCRFIDDRRTCIIRICLRPYTYHSSLKYKRALTQHLKQPSNKYKSKTLFNLAKAERAASYADEKKGKKSAKKSNKKSDKKAGKRSSKKGDGKAGKKGKKGKKKESKKGKKKESNKGKKKKGKKGKKKKGKQKSKR